MVSNPYPDDDFNDFLDFDIGLYAIMITSLLAILTLGCINNDFFDSSTQIPT